MDVASSTPRWTQEDSIKAVPSVFWESEVRNLKFVRKFEVVCVHDLDLVLTNSINVGIMSCILDFLRVHIRSYTMSTSSRKLNCITAYSTKSVKNITALSKLIAYSLSNMLCHWLRSDRIPTLVID